MEIREMNKSELEQRIGENIIPDNLTGPFPIISQKVINDRQVQVTVKFGTSQVSFPMCFVEYNCLAVSDMEITEFSDVWNAEANGGQNGEEGSFRDKGMGAGVCGRLQRLSA